MEPLATLKETGLTAIREINELYQSSRMLRNLKMKPIYSWEYKHDNSDQNNKRVICKIHFNMYNRERKFSDQGRTMKEAQMNVARRFMAFMHREMEKLEEEPRQPADGQMDSTDSTVQGEDNVEGEKFVNTILTTGVTSTQSLTSKTEWKDLPHILHKLSTGEEIVSFPTLLNRFLQIDHFELNITDTYSGTTTKKEYSLPSSIYSQLSMPNRVPFQQFVFCRPSIELKFKVNSHKFAQGRYLVSFMYAIDGISQAIVNSTSGAVMRDHAYLDLNESNEAVLNIPYEALTPWIPCLTNESTEIASRDFATVAVHVISPLRVGEGSVTTVPVTVFARFTQCLFTGLRYYKDTTSTTAEGQMGQELSKDLIGGIRNLPVVGGLAGAATSTLSHLALAVQRPFRDEETMKEVESRFKYVGLIKNRDKPLIYDQPPDLRPNYAGNIALGRYPEPVMPMRLDPAATTVSLPEHCVSGGAESVKDMLRIWTIKDIITWKQTDATQTILWTDKETPGFTKDTTVVYTALQSIMAHYQYYAGSVEYRFDIVGTQFHTGTLMISWIPYNSDYTYSEARAGYFKTIDLREQRTFTFRVPFISDTVVRQLNGRSDYGLHGYIGTQLGAIKLWVVNPMTPIQAVPMEMDIIIYVRAGPDFQASFLKTNIGTLFEKPSGLGYGTKYEAIRSIDMADGQMDTGDKENFDTSPDFGLVLPTGTNLQLNEDHMNVYDLCRRWEYQGAVNVDGDFSIPITTPGHWVESLTSYIASNHRWYRGSIRIMLVSGDKGLVYSITHCPQGSALPGKGTVLADGTTEKAMRAKGLWDPAVNGSIKFEIPFHGQFNYLDCLVLPSASGYRQTSGNLGFLIVSPLSTVTKTTKVHYYFACGDDFHFEKFVGNPKSTVRFNALLPSKTVTCTYTSVNSNTSNLYYAVGLNPGTGTEVTNGNTFSVVPPNYLQVSFGNGYTFKKDVEMPTQGITIYNAGGGSMVVKYTLTSDTTEVTKTVTSKTELAIPYVDIATIEFRWAVTTPTAVDFINGENYPRNYSYMGTGDTTVTKGVLLSGESVSVKSPGMCILSYNTIGVVPAIPTVNTLYIGTFANEFTVSSAKIQYPDANYDYSNYIVKETKYTYPIGVSKITSRVQNFSLADGQMDNEEINDPLMRGLTGPTNAVLPTTRTWDFLSRTRDSVMNTISSPIQFYRNATDTVTRAPIVLNTLSATAGKVDQVLEYLKDVANNIVNGIKTSFSWIKATGPIFSSILHFLQCVINPGWKSFVLALCGVFSSIGTFFGDIGQKLLDFFLSLPVRDSQDQQAGSTAANGQIDDEEPFFNDEQIGSLCAAIFGSVAAFCGYKGEAPGVSTTRKLFNFQVGFWRTIYQSGRFLTSIVTVVKRTFKWICQKMNINQPAAILTSENRATQAFIEEAQKMTDQRNLGAMATDPTMKYRFWCCVASAYQYQARLSANSTPEGNAVLRICKTVIELGNKESIQAMACPVRYEPFVMALRGATALGKSYLCQDILPKLMGDPDVYGIETYDNPIFTRTPGVEFWNGFRNHPWILYDDYLASLAPEVCARQVIELYNLKSTAIMNANMANLNDKDMRVNPFGVTLLMNGDVVPNGVTCPDAFRRRKDTYWVLTLKSEYTDIASVPDDIKRVYGHLEFAKVKNPTRPQELEAKIGFEAWYEKIKEEMKAYHVKEQANVRLRMERLKTLLPVKAREMMHEVDPFKIFYAAHTGSADESGAIQTGMLPSELVDIQLNTIAEAENAIREMIPNLEEVNPGEASGQFDFMDYAQKLWHQFMYCEANPNVPYYGRSQTTFGDCPVCIDTDVEIQLVCVNGHTFCGACARGMTNAAWDNGSVMTCAVCRGEVTQIEIDPEYGGECLRMAVWWNRVRRGTSSFCRLARFRWHQFYYNCDMRSVLTVAASFAYSVMYLYFSWKTYENRRAQAEQDLRWLLTMERAARGQIDEFEDASDQPIRSNQVKSAITLPRQRVTTQDFCPHNLLLTVSPDDIFYEINQADNEGEWVCGLWRTTRHTNFACQYEDCFMRDLDRYTDFMHAWGNAHPAELNQAREDFDLRRVNVWKYPDCFLPASAVGETRRRRNEMVEAIENYGRQHTFWDTICDKLKEFNQYLKVIGAVVAGIVAFTGAYKLMQWARGEEAIPEGQIINSGSFHNSRLPRQPRRIRSASGQNGDRTQVVYGKIERNTFFINALYNGTIMKNRGFGLFGRIGLIPKHVGKWMLYQDKKNKDTKWSIQSFSNPEVEVSFNLNEMKILFSDNEQCYINTPVTFPMFADITNFVPTVEQHNDIMDSYTHVECMKDKKLVMAIQGTIKGIRAKQTLKATDFHEQYDMTDVYETTYGRAGACGSVYISENTSPIFAMHVAGFTAQGNGTGFGIPLVREDLIDLKSGVLPVTTFVPNELQDVAEAQMQLSGAIVPIGKVPKNRISFMPVKSKIVPSKLQGQIEGIPVLTQPGILTAKDERYCFDGSPLLWGCMKHTRPIGNMNEGVLSEISSFLKNEFIQKMKPLRKLNKDLTYSEAIVGIPDKTYYDCLDLKTSSGWPWNLANKQTKEEWMTVTRDPKTQRAVSAVCDPDLVRTLDQKKRMRQLGIKPFTVFLDWLKDERRKESKLQKPDGTRIFSLSPLDFTIQMRQEMLDFSAAFMHSRLDLPHAVGISADGPEWTKLAMSLKRNSGKIVTGDYSDFGPRLSAQALYHSFDIIWEWYKANGCDKQEKKNVLFMMYEEIAHSYHLMHDYVYEVMCGAPSGSAMTVILNSIVNIIYIYYAYYYLVETDLTNFSNNVVLFTYGDDLIMSVKDEIIEKFNCETIGKLFDQELDLKFTDAAKSGNVKYDTLENSTFLKRGFLKHPRREEHYLAPLEELSFHECAQWIWKSPSVNIATEMNAEQSILLSYSHGPQVYQHWQSLVNSALKKNGLKTFHLTWDAVDRKFFGELEPVGHYLPYSRLCEFIGLNANIVAADGLDREGVDLETSRRRVLHFTHEREAKREIKIVRSEEEAEREEADEYGPL